jgi:hypothetical protein
MTLARVDLANLVYVIGALVAASLVSGVYVLLHRKPKSMEAGIDAFSRELRALAPGRRSRASAGGPDSGQVELRSTVAPGRTQHEQARRGGGSQSGDENTG